MQFNLVNGNFISGGGTSVVNGDVLFLPSVGGLPTEIPAGNHNDQLALIYGRTASENINDAAVRYYGENGATSGQINDAGFEALRAAGNTGTINDMKRSQFGRA